MFKLVFLSNYMFEILHQDIILKHNTCSGVLRCKSFDFVSCIRVLIVRILQNGLILLVYLSIQSHLSPYLQDSILPIQVAFEKFLLSRSFKSSTYPFRFLELTSDCPKMSKSFYCGIFSIFQLWFPHNY